MGRTRVRVITSGAAALAFAAAFPACEEPAGPELYRGVPTLEVGVEAVVAGLPEGDYAVSFSVVDWDTAAASGLLEDMGLAPRPTTDVWRGTFAETLELGTSFGAKSYVAARWYKIDGLSDRRDDPRKPLLVLNTNLGDDGDYLGGIDHIRFRSPTSFPGRYCTNGPCWTIMNDLDRIGANDSWFAMGLVRYALKVNGLLDQIEHWVEGEVEEPDSLIPLPFNPGGYPDHQADWWHGFTSSRFNEPEWCPDVPADANPFIFGHFKTGPTVDPHDPGADFDGETDADWCFTGAGRWGNSIEDEVTSPFAPNEPKRFDLPQYNYFVIWQYDRESGQVLYDKPVLRAQIGVDIDLNGNPIPNAYAPFPLVPGHPAGTDPWKSRVDFLADPRVAAGAGKASFTVTGLPAFSGLEYQVWLYHQSTGVTKRVPVAWLQQKPDTVGVDELGQPIIRWTDLAARATVQSFTSQGAGMRHLLELRRAILAQAGAELKGFTHVVITTAKVGEQADPTVKNAVVSFRYADPKGTPDNFFDDVVNGSGKLLFSFLPGPVAQLGQSWKVFGAGNVKYSGDQEFGLILNRFARPPAGWYYEVWLVKLDEKGAVLQEKNLGAITSPAPEFASLRDADVTTGELVTETEILKAAKFARVSEAGASSLNDFSAIWVTLEPKDGADNERSPFRIFAAQIPPDLAKVPVGGS